MRKIGGNARVWLLAMGLFGTSRTAAAQSHHVGNECPRLTAAEYDELDARVLLLLGSRHDTRRLPVVGCDERRAWLEWAGRRRPLPGRAPIADEALDALEDAQREEAAVDALANLPEPPPVPPESRWRARARRAQGGGVAMGVEIELGNAASIGPGFDLAMSVGPVLLGVREVFRIATTGADGAFLDVQALLAYGAPLRPRAPLGAVARFGGECFAATTRGGTTRAECISLLDVGGRLAFGVGATAFWLGVDARLRFSRFTINPVEPISEGESPGHSRSARRSSTGAPEARDERRVSLARADVVRHGHGRRP